jgi:hypothetical protein
LPFFSGGAAALQFRTSLVSQPIVAGSQSRVLACEYLCYVILVFVTFLDVLSLQIISPREIILCLLSLPALLFLFCVLSKENLAPPSRLRFGVLFCPLVELASAFYPDILCCSCVIDFMSRMCHDILSCESVLSVHSEPYPCL